MTVKELIAELQKCDQDAVVDVQGYNEYALDLQLRESFLGAPSNKTLSIYSSLTEKSSELEEAEDKVEDVKEKITNLYVSLGGNNEQ